jgi:hypothetical protein
MWKLCQDCGYEIDPDLYSAFEAENYGCPICGSFNLDDEVVDTSND